MEMEEPLLPKGPAGQHELDPEARRVRRPYPDPFYCPLTRRVMEDPVVDADGIAYERSAVLERDAATRKEAEQSYRQGRRADEEDDPQQQQDDGSSPKEYRPEPEYYPNRALQLAIEGEVRSRAGLGAARGALRRAEEGLRAGIDAVLAQIQLRAATDDADVDAAADGDGGGDEEDGLGDKNKRPSHRPLPDACYCPITLDIIVRPAIDPDGNSYERLAIRGWVRRNGNSPLTRRKMNVHQLRDNKALEEVIMHEVDKAADHNDPSILRWKEARAANEDEEDRLSALLEETDGAEAAGDDGPLSRPTPAEMEENLSLSTGQCVFSFAVVLLLLSWMAFALVPLGIVPLNILIYVVMGLLIAFLNIVLVETMAGTVVEYVDGYEGGMVRF